MYFTPTIVFIFKENSFFYVNMLRESTHSISIMKGISILFPRSPENVYSNSLDNRIYSIKKSNQLQKILPQDDIDAALNEQEFLKKWIEANRTEVNNALQTLRLSMNNIFVAIGFINSIDVTRRKAVIIAFLQNQDVQN